MNDQLGTVDRMVDQWTGPPAADTRGDGPPVSDMAPLFGTPVGGAESTARGADASEEAPAASLVGSLSVFTLSDVLSMLASTGQSGELQVVSETVDGRVWLDHGELSNAHVGATTTIGQAVFELACVTDGWFYFTSGVRSSSGQPAVPVDLILSEVRPQVEEWRELRQVVPLESIVTLAPSPPGQDIQIRSEQWRVLTTVGTSGISVRSVLETVGGDQMVGLRTLRDLRAAGLVALGTEPVDPPDVGVAPPFPAAPGNGSSPSPAPSPSLTISEDAATDDLASAPPPTGSTQEDGPDGDRFDSLAEVAIMPPPIAGDPWAPSPEPAASDGNGVA
jgi:hypothetical protein